MNSTDVLEDEGDEEEGEAHDIVFVQRKTRRTGGKFGKKSSKTLARHVIIKNTKIGAMPKAEVSRTEHSMLQTETSMMRFNK